MTEEQRDILIAKMLGEPSSLTDGELDAILGDEELRDICGVSSAVSGASLSGPELDMDKEWELFRPRIRRKPSLTRRFMRLAAIFLGISIVSGITANLVDYIFSSGYKDNVAKVEHLKTPKTADATAETALGSVAGGVSEKVDAADTKFQPSTPVKTQKRGNAARRRRVSPAAPANAAVQPEEIDIDEYLRIQQARIDNDLAMQTAAIYEEQYSNLLPSLDASGLNSDDIDKVIANVTME